MVIGRFEKIRQSAEAEPAGLVGAATNSVGACAHSEAAQLDLHGSKLHAISGELLSGTRKKMMRELLETQQGARSGRATHQEITAVHSISL